MAAEPSPAPDLSFPLRSSPDLDYGGAQCHPRFVLCRLAGVRRRKPLCVWPATWFARAPTFWISAANPPGPDPKRSPLHEELKRVLPVLEALHDRWPGLPLSVDTQKSEVARQALAHGAGLINDISALRHDPEMADVLAEAGCPIVLMHMQGTPETMQQEPRYADVVDDIKQFFEERLAFAAAHAFAKSGSSWIPESVLGKPWSII